MLFLMRWRGRLAALGVMVLVTGASATAWATTSPASSPVRLVLPHHALRAGQSVQVTIIKPASRDLLISACPLLQLREAHGWKAITQTHGVHVGCSLTNSVPFNADEHTWGLILYDDLQPGTYRITMAYKVLPRHWRTANLKHHYRLTRAELTVLRFRPGPAPHLSERRIKRIALKAAGGHATLIQHAEGTRFDANRIAGGDLIWDWHWAYLIAIKGHFKFNPSGPSGSYAPDHAEGLGKDTAGKRTGPQSYTVITLVLDAQTGRGEDFGVSNDYPDIAQLGPVTTDYRR